MPTYNYKARDASGSAVKGSMEAASKNEVVDKLHKTGYMATHVAQSISGINLEQFFQNLKAVSTDEMILFNIQLSNMIEAGISILSSLDTLSNQIQNKRLREAIGGVRRSIEAGDNFSSSLKNYPGIFSGLFINMVKAGEASGKLDKVLAKYAEFYERQADLKEKIRGALFYPVILLIAGIVVTLFIVTFVIPQFAEIFMKSGIRLPMATLILYKIGLAIKAYWYVGVIAVAVLCLAFKSYSNTVAGRLKIDRIKLALPIIGPLYRKVSIARFARTLGTLVESGVSILESLDIVRDVVGNEVLANTISQVRITVERGEHIADHLKISKEFPPDTVQMIAIGEESGSLDKMLNKISEFYDMSLGYAIKRLTALIEPIFLVIMGSLIGFIMASMLLPIFDMIKILGH
ncbi:MAG: type II secretion system F family protein [Candidatus Omnitrophota bacterium]